MKFEYWVIGKTKEKYFLSAEAEYIKRLKRYTKLKYVTYNEYKGKYDAAQLKNKEGEMILSQLSDSDHLILLDERGKEYTSEKFADLISQFQMSTSKRVIFLTGGAYGFSEAIYSRANGMLSLSKMTFSHQMIRTFFLEQFYRAFTIINNEKYHNS